jgi:hypothetical protein
MNNFKNKAVIMAGVSVLTAVVSFNMAYTLFSIHLISVKNNLIISPEGGTRGSMWANIEKARKRRTDSERTE